MYPSFTYFWKRKTNYLMGIFNLSYFRIHYSRLQNHFHEKSLFQTLTFSQSRRGWSLNLWRLWPQPYIFHKSVAAKCLIISAPKAEHSFCKNIHQLCKQSSIYLGSIMLWKLKKVWTNISRVHHFWSLIKNICYIYINCLLYCWLLYLIKNK